MSHEDAGLAAGFYGDLKLCHIVNKTVRFELRKAAIGWFAGRG